VHVTLKRETSINRPNASGRVDARESASEMSPITRDSQSADSLEGRDRQDDRKLKNPPPREGGREATSRYETKLRRWTGRRDTETAPTGPSLPLRRVLFANLSDCICRDTESNRGRSRGILRVALAEATT